MPRTPSPAVVPAIPFLKTVPGDAESKYMSSLAVFTATSGSPAAADGRAAQARVTSASRVRVRPTLRAYNG
jgi:hypothetical protein